jgi:hypothetical protein
VILAIALSAAALLQSGDFPAAQRAYEAQWQANHADSDAAFALTQLAIYDNRVADAERWLTVARTAAPQDPRIARDENVLRMRSDPSIDRVVADPGTTIVPFVQTDPLPMVDVEIDGKKTLFLIDTGAPNIVVDSSLATSIGLSVSSAHQGTFAGGLHAAVAQAMVPTLTLGTLALQNVPATVMPVGNLMGNGRKVGGILGTALFEHFLTTLDYRTGRLVLRDPGQSAPFESEAEASGATIVPMWLVGDHFVFVRAHVANGPEGLFNIDTGGTFGVQLTKDAIDAAGITLDTEETRTGIGGGGATSFIPFAASVTLGGLTRSNLDGVYTPQGSQYSVFPFAITGTISHQFFRRLALTFDFRAMKVVLE